MQLGYRLFVVVGVAAVIGGVELACRPGQRGAMGASDATNNSGRERGNPLTRPPSQLAAARTERRTPWGEPDLQGTWDFATLTPLQRPSALTGKAALTQPEAEEFERQTRDRIFGNRLDESGRRPLNSAQDREVWWDPGTSIVSDKRVSLIVDPEDGRVPPLTPEGLRRAGNRRGTTRYEGPEDAGTHYARCLLSINSGPPLLPSAYNNYVQLVQTPGYVTIFTEMIHDARVVPLDGRPHLPEDIRLWMGDSRGRWEGQTLVLETTNFRDRPNFTGPTLFPVADPADDLNRIQFAATPNMRLVERFTLTDLNTLRYEFTVDDPAAFTRPWTGMIPMRRSQDPIYEYACHEGNDSLMSILRTQRSMEKKIAR